LTRLEERIGTRGSAGRSRSPSRRAEAPNDLHPHPPVGCLQRQECRPSPPEHGSIQYYCVLRQRGLWWHPRYHCCHAVPEPATVALLNLGVAAVGWTLRRRRGVG